MYSTLKVQSQQPDGKLPAVAVMLQEGLNTLEQTQHHTCCIRTFIAPQLTSPHHTFCQSMTQTCESQHVSCPRAGHADADVSSPGVQTTATGTFSPLLSVSIGASSDPLHSPLDSGSYASADAARVGGGLYKHLLQAACTLATDPAPKVARIGKAALRVADVELAPISTAAGQLILSVNQSINMSWSGDLLVANRQELFCKN